MRIDKKIASVASAGVLLISGAVVLPQAMAANKTATMSVTCTASDIPLIGSTDFSAGDVNINVEAPEKVTVGEEFETTFSIDPVKADLSGLPMGATITEAWRLKLDLQLPPNLTNVTTSIDESNANLKGIKALKVNDSGNVDPNGEFIRLTSADNATIGNGPNSKSAPGGVSYRPSGKTLELSFPTITLKATATAPGNLDFGVRTKGQAGSHNNDQNFLTLGASVKVSVFKPNVTARCSPRTAADAPLDERASRLISIEAEDQKPAQDTSVALTAPEATAGKPTELTATVSPAEATGTVVFKSGSMTSAAIEVENGKATTQMTFPEAGTHPVTATFTPADAAKFNASSGQQDITVEGQDAGLQLQAPDTVNAADGTVDVTAKVDANAEGTVEFSLGDGSVVSQKVTNGEATASLPIGDATGASELKAVFKPATGSPFKTATATKNVTIEAAAHTTMALTAEGEATVGQPATVVAHITPSEGTTEAKGEVTFTYDGAENKVEVQDNKAVLELTPETAGELVITANYAPVDRTQSAATAETTLTVAEKVDPQASVSLNVALPGSIEKGKPVDATVTVTPDNATGTVSTMVEGKKVEAEVVNGTATLPLTFTETGAKRLTFTFTPTDAKKFTDASNSADITVTDPGEVMPEEPGEPGESGEPGDNQGDDTPGDEAPTIPEEINDVVITPGEALQGDIVLGKVEGKTANVTVADADGKGVFGTLKVLVDGKPAQLNGEDAEISVVGGKAKWIMDIFDAGKHVVTLQFFDTNSVLKGSKNVEVNVRNVEVDPSNISN